jgi:hypothetical protein
MAALGSTARLLSNGVEYKATGRQGVAWRI